MTNTMEDLRKEVATRLRETLHGREIDTMEKGMPEIEHMIGVVPIGAISTKECEKGTILDPHTDFWNDYEEDVKTKGKVKDKIATAMQSLEDDGTFDISWPYGEDGGIAYVEVDEYEDRSNSMTTECRECGAIIPFEETVEQLLTR